MLAQGIYPVKLDLMKSPGRKNQDGTSLMTSSLRLDKKVSIAKRNSTRRTMAYKVADHAIEKTNSTRKTEAIPKKENVLSLIEKQKSVQNS